ncbi:MAG: hypothetical protein ACRELD_08905 [Longimicrobiales bacterium]
MEVRARFTNESAIRRSQGLDEPILYLDGRVVEAGPDTLALDVLIARSTSVFQDITIRDTISVRVSELQSVTAREIAVGRSILFAAALGTGVALAVAGISAITGGNEGEPGDNGSQAAVLPLSILWRAFPLLKFSIP